VFFALALATGGAVALAGHSHAAGCTPTPYLRDGMPLTAAVVVPTAGSADVTGTVNASGCNIGVYFSPASTGTVDHATIDGSQGGPNYYGVLVDQAQADVTNSVIENIGENPPSGAQHGIAVAYVSGDASGSGDSATGPAIAPASGTIANDTIQRYQKGGVVVAGSQADVTTDNNLVQGLGPVPLIAQNGIQYSHGAAGAIFTNTVTDNYYTGSGTFSTGILLYDINPPQINKYNNFYRNDQRNLIVVPSASLK
jgi:hypothetical protein